MQVKFDKRRGPNSLLLPLLLDKGKIFIAFIRQQHHTFCWSSTPVVLYRPFDLANCKRHDTYAVRCLLLTRQRSPPVFGALRSALTL